MRPPWSDDLSTFTLEGVIAAQTENKVWEKHLRTSVTALMDSKLAKKIGPEEYATCRKAANEESEECRRRRRMLADEIAQRGHRRVYANQARASRALGPELP